MIAQKYKDILSKAKPYLFCNAKNIEFFNMSPLGVKIEDDLTFDCLNTNSEEFFNLITKMDEISFGDQGMGMDRWVMFDCSAMPGAIFGLALCVSDIDEDLKQKMGISDNYSGYVPVSMYIAIPTIEPGHWFGHNLSSLNTNLKSKLPGLGLLTKAMGLLTLKIDEQYGATQWNSPAINIHAKLAPLKLLSTITPVHTYRNSLAYIASYTDDSIMAVLSNIDINMPKESFKLSSDDANMLEKMQTNIENGVEYYICGRPVIQSGVSTYPIHEGKK